jgi:hypothetical protein
MTIKHWLQTIKDPIVRKHAIHNIYINNSIKFGLIAKHYTENVLDIESAIRYGFFWSSTKEGYDYWHNIAGYVY